MIILLPFFNSKHVDKQSLWYKNPQFERLYYQTVCELVPHHSYMRISYLPFPISVRILT
jgi:hypothetical protein